MENIKNIIISKDNLFFISPKGLLGTEVIKTAIEILELNKNI